MKQLKCEMCGSTELLKQEGVFVCQNCNAKYSIEEAKKMMVEGTVEVQGTITVDSSEETQNLYQLARRAKDDGNDESAAKYYDMILIRDSKNWEAAFYSVYFKAINIKISQVEAAGMSVAGCLGTVFSLIADNISDKEEQKKAYAEVADRVMEIAKLFYYGAQKAHLNIEKWTGAAVSVIGCLFALGDDLDEVFGSENEANNLSVIAWKQGIEWGDRIPGEAMRDMNAEYCDKINKYDKTFDEERKYEKLSIRHLGACLSYIESIKNTKSKEDLSRFIGYRESLIEYMKTDEYKNKKVSQLVLNEIEKVMEFDVEQYKKGCYVATCVYGSYDCPQVWTLRRYRDLELDRTWYGRAFIKTYYSISPTIVKWFGETEWFKKLWKGKLDKMVAKLQEQGYENTKYNDKY